MVFSQPARVAADAASTLKLVTLELGGKSALVVFVIAFVPEISLWLPSLLMD